MALPAQNRLPLRFERDRLTREGKTFHTRHFTIIMAPSPATPGSDQESIKSSFRPSKASGEISLHDTSASPHGGNINNSSVIPTVVEESLSPSPHHVPRFAILLSKKTAKLAVDRNRIRRRTSAILAELLPKLPPADYLVIPKRSVLDTPYPDLLSNLSSLLPKLT